MTFSRRERTGQAPFLWTATAHGPHGQRHFHVLAHTQVEAARVAALEAPGAHRVRVRLCDVEDPAQRLALRAAAVDRG